MSDTVKLEGFHGTSTTNADAILKEGFKSSLGDEEWLGDGVYFFTEGIPPPPQNNAVKWAIASAWDNSKKSYKYNEYAVIRANIDVEEPKFIDLTTFEGMEIFSYLRKKYIESIEKSGMRSKPFKDGHIINRARVKLGLEIDAIKSRFYIKFKTERILNINFRVPNATIIAVFNVNVIDNDTFSIVKKGKVNHET